MDRDFLYTLEYLYISLYKNISLWRFDAFGNIVIPFDKKQTLDCSIGIQVYRIGISLWSFQQRLIWFNSSLHTWTTVLKNGLHFIYLKQINTVKIILFLAVLFSIWIRSDILLILLLVRE